MLCLRVMKYFRPLRGHTGQQLDACNQGARRGVKVTVVGAAGGVGQPLSLLLKQNPLISELCLYDKVNTKGVAEDLSHVCTRTTVSSFRGEKELICALQQSAIVVVPAGFPRKPGISLTEQLYENGCMAVSVAKAVSSACPAAFLAFLTSPVNTIVPIAAEVLRQEDAYDPRRLFGITTLDVMRAKTFIGELLGVDPQTVDIPVVGGNEDDTILPVLSQCQPALDVVGRERERLIKRIQLAASNVVKAKDGKGSCTLSAAHAAAHFVDALLRCINNEKNVVECAYVQSDVSEAEFFASPVHLGPRGVKDCVLPEMDEKEEAVLAPITKELSVDIELGYQFAAN